MTVRLLAATALRLLRQEIGKTTWLSQEEQAHWFAKSLTNRQRLRVLAGAVHRGVWSSNARLVLMRLTDSLTHEGAMPMSTPTMCAIQIFYALAAIEDGDDDLELAYGQALLEKASGMIVSMAEKS